MRTAALLSAEDFARVAPRGGTSILLRDTDQVSADPHIPGLAIQVSRFFED